MDKRLDPEIMRTGSACFEYWEDMYEDGEIELDELLAAIEAYGRRCAEATTHYVAYDDAPPFDEIAHAELWEQDDHERE